MLWVKRIMRAVIFWFGPLAVAGGGFWFYMQGGRYITTDNAYLKAEMVSVSSELSGKVTQVLVQDNARVEAGQLLFTLDDQVYRIALARAEANLAKVRSQLLSMRAELVNKQADVEKVQSDHSYFAHEYERLQNLAKSSSVSAAQVDQAEHQSVQTRKELDISRQSLEITKALLVDPALPIEQHPDYQLALIEREKAQLDLSHVEVHAPMGGIVAHFEVKPGEMVVAGVPLFSVVDNSHMWVEANFKETDLTWLRLGQSAEIEVDTYPDIKWHAKVDSMTPGTGGEFSLLPAQNSSGNWVKVVQRITVRFDLELPANSPTLAAGMSAYVSVDSGHKQPYPWQ